MMYFKGIEFEKPEIHSEHTDGRLWLYSTQPPSFTQRMPLNVYDKDVYWYKAVYVQENGVLYLYAVYNYKGHINIMEFEFNEKTRSFTLNRVLG